MPNRLPPLNQSIGPCRPLSSPSTSPDVACSIHLRVKTINLVNFLIRDIHSTSDSDTIPPPLRSHGDLAAALRTRDSLPPVLRAIQRSRIWVPSVQAGQRFGRTVWSAGSFCRNCAAGLRSASCCCAKGGKSGSNSSKDWIHAGPETSVLLWAYFVGAVSVCCGLLPCGSCSEVCVSGFGGVCGQCGMLCAVGSFEWSGISLGNPRTHGSCIRR